MRSRQQRTKQLASVAILIAVAFVLSWIEMLLSIPMVIPGVKIGLANLAIIFALYYCGTLPAFFVLAGRLLLTSILFGNITSLIMSISGGVLSFLAMCVCKKLLKNHLIYVSIFGGIAHNLGQLLAASILLHTSYVRLIPYLLIGGILAGAFNGFTANLLLRSPAFRSKP